MMHVQLSVWILGLILTIANANLFDYSKISIKKPAKLNAYKAALTQHGYIQFLRYELNVPEINEFTYCIWLKSVNFSHSHPLLSYSLHESDRLIRGWVGEHGTTISLAILEEIAYTFPVQLKEHAWYHICQSWDTFTGYSSLHLNGKLLYSQYNEKIHGIVVPEHGDIVVGQEYTDFDKGLDDGIEGFVYGFNMILKSIFMKNNLGVESLPTKHKPIGSHGGYNELISMTRIPAIQSSSPFNHNSLLSTTLYGSRKGSHKPLGYKPVKYTYDNEDDNSHRLNLLRRNHVITGKPMNSLINLRPPPHPGRHHIRNFRSNMNVTQIVPGRAKRFASQQIDHDTSILETLPLGIQLIEMGFKNCLKGRGGPLMGEKVLINWSLTPVRVFGGAILKPAKAICGDF